MKKQHVFAALVAVLLWGTSFPLLKGSLVDFPPLFATTLRLFFIGLIGVSLAPRLRLKKPIQFIMLASTMWAIPLATTTMAMQHVDASIAAMITELEVFFAALISYFYFRERVTYTQLGGFALASLGVFIIVGSPEIPTYSLGPMALLLSAAFCYGVAANIVKSIGKDMNPLAITGWTALLAAPQTGILALMLEKIPSTNHFTIGYEGVLFLTLSSLSSLGAYYVWNDLLQKYRVNQVTPFGLLIPVASLVFSYFLLGETTHLAAIGGGALATTGVWLQTRS